MVRLFAVKIPETTGFSDLEKQLSVIRDFDYSALKSKYKNVAALQHHVFGNLLVKMQLRRMIFTDQQEVSIYYNEHAKPMLSGQSNVHFNISHSGRWVVAAFAEKPVGIDIERVKTANMLVAHRFFSEEEIAFLTQKQMTERDEWFFRFWTLKESYLKAIGTGLSKPLSSFVIKFEGEKIYLLDEGLPVQANLLHLDFDSDYKISVCAFDELIDRQPLIIEADELIGFFNT